MIGLKINVSVITKLSIQISVVYMYTINIDAWIENTCIKKMPEYGRKQQASSYFFNRDNSVNFGRLTNYLYLSLFLINVKILNNVLKINVSRSNKNIPKLKNRSISS